MGKCLSHCTTDRASSTDSSQDQVASVPHQHEAVPVSQENRLFISYKGTGSSVTNTAKSSSKKKYSNFKKHCRADLPPTSRSLPNIQQNVSASRLQSRVNVTSSESTSGSDIRKSEASSHFGLKRLFTSVQRSIISFRSQATATDDKKCANILTFPANRAPLTHPKNSEISFSSVPRQDGITFDVGQLRTVTECHPTDAINLHVNQSESSPKFDQNEAATRHSQVLLKASTSWENTSEPYSQISLSHSSPQSTASIILSIVGLFSLLWKSGDGDDISQEDSLEEPQDNSTSNTQENRILSEYPLSDEIILHMSQSRISSGATSASPPDAPDHRGSQEATTLHSYQSIKNRSHRPSPSPSVTNDFIYAIGLASLFKKNGNLKSQSTSVPTVMMK